MYDPTAPIPPQVFFPPSTLTNVVMDTVNDGDVPMFEASKSRWRAQPPPGAPLAPGGVNTFYTSDGVTNGFHLLNKDSTISGDGVGTPLSVAIPAASLGPAGTIFDSDGVTNAFRAPNLSAQFSGNLVTTPLTLVNSGTTGGTQIFGQQMTFDTTGRLTGRANLDNTLAGGTSPYTTSLVGQFIGTQSCAGSSATIMTVNGSTADTHFFQARPSWWDNFGTMTIPFTGWWRINVTALWPVTGGSVRIIQILATTQNPVTTNFEVDRVAVYSTGNNTSLALPSENRYTAGDQITILTFHDVASAAAVRWHASISPITQSSP